MRKDIWLFMAGGILIGTVLTTHVLTSRQFNPVPLENAQNITDAFHRLYHNNSWNETVLNTTWLGVPAMQLPLDMWVYQEIIFETRPTVIVETGTRVGGSALYFASLLDLLGDSAGRVITVDIVEYSGRPDHPRIQFLKGSSTAPEIVAQIRGEIEPGDRVMVFLDSDHSQAHVSQELELYSPLVTPGCYLIVEDTHLNGHPIRTPVSPGPGPWEAVEMFLSSDPGFERDQGREKFRFTFNPGGFLRRSRGPAREADEPRPSATSPIANAGP